MGVIQKINMGQSRNLRRGDIYYADLTGIEQTIGSEQTGKRPVLIIQNDIGNKYSPTTIAAIITTKEKRHMPTHVTFSNTKILPQRSIICTEQIKTLDKCRLLEFCGNVGTEVMCLVENAIACSMGVKKWNQNSIEEHKKMQEENEALELIKRETVLDGGNRTGLNLRKTKFHFS